MTADLIPAPPRPPRPLLPKHERFAQQLARHGDAVAAYRAVYRSKANGMASYGGLRSNAFRLSHRPDVAARVRELLAEAAQAAGVDAAARAARLQQIVDADPREIFQVTAEPCPKCWPAESTDSQPNPSCGACRGEGTRRVVITPTDELSPAGRALLKSVRQRANGEIEIRLHDQLVAADILNKMQGVYVEHRVNVNFNVTPLEKMSREQQLEFLQSLKPTT